MYKNKVIIAIAPAARHGDEKAEKLGEEIPLLSVMTPEEIGDDVIECAKLGASIVHLHVRDSKGHLTEDLTEFSRTIDLINQGADMIIEGSTGGVSELTREQRCVALNVPNVNISALNMGSINLGEGGFLNTLDDIRFWAKEMMKKRIIPIMECFEPGMIETARILMEDEKIIFPPVVYGLCLGFAGTQPAKTNNLQLMVNTMPKDSVFYYQQHGMEDFAMIAAAIAAGAKIVRVGFEDSIYYAPGKTAISNAHLVEELVYMIDSIGYSVATVDEAREIIGLKA